MYFIKIIEYSKKNLVMSMPELSPSTTTRHAAFARFVFNFVPGDTGDSVYYSDSQDTKQAITTHTETYLH